MSFCRREVSKQVARFDQKVACACTHACSWEKNIKTKQNKTKNEFGTHLQHQNQWKPKPIPYLSALTDISSEPPPDDVEATMAYFFYVLCFIFCLLVHFFFSYLLVSFVAVFGFGLSFVLSFSFSFAFSFSCSFFFVCMCICMFRCFSVFVLKKKNYRRPGQITKSPPLKRGRFLDLREFSSTPFSFDPRETNTTQWKEAVFSRRHRPTTENVQRVWCNT